MDFMDEEPLPASVSLQPIRAELEYTDAVLRARHLRILTLDGGGVGVQSQLRLIEEIFQRIKWDARHIFSLKYPCFDLTEGSGIGGFAAACLGRLAMSIDQTMKEVMAIAPFLSSMDEYQTSKQRSDGLKAAVEDMLQRHGFPIDLRFRKKPGEISDLYQRRRRDVESIFSSGYFSRAALLAVPKSNLSTPYAFRSYESRGYQYDCTFVEAVCATLAIPGLFEPVAIGPEGMKQEYISPLGFHNPTEEAIKEAKDIYGADYHIGVLLSLGSGRPRVLSLDDQSPEFMNCRSLGSQIVMDCEKAAFDVKKSMPKNAPYYRLNVDHGMENIDMFDWKNTGTILSHTDTWIQKNTEMIDQCVEAFLGNGPTIRIGDLLGIPKQPPIPRLQPPQDQSATADTSFFGPYRRSFSALFHRNTEVVGY